MKDTIRTIRRSSHLFFSGTLLSRFSGMLRDMAMAYVFGTQASIATFMVSFRLALLLRRLFSEGTLQSAFTPEFEALRYQKEESAFALFRDLTIVLAILLTLIILLGGSLLGFGIWMEFFKPVTQNILFLTLLMLPSLLFICLFGLNATFLQCEKKFFIPSAAPIAFNGVWIAFVFYLKGMSAEKAMPWLAIGIVVACFFQWLITVPQTWKSLHRVSTFSFWTPFNRQSSDLYLLKKPLVLGVLGVAASQINNAIDSIFALFAEAEGPALLWYAIRVQQLPLALFGIAIAGAVLPPLARARQAQQMERYQEFLHDALTRTWVFILPLTAALFVLGESIVTLLFGHGLFDHHSIVQTTHCLWAYAVGLIPSALILILAPAYYSQNNYKTPALSACLSMGLNLFFNTLFIFGFGLGAISIALATSLSAWINVFFLGWNLNRTGTALFSRTLVTGGILQCVITVLATAATYGFSDIWFRSAAFALSSSPFAKQLLYFSIQFSTFSFVFLSSQSILYLIQHYSEKTKASLSSKD